MPTPICVVGTIATDPRFSRTGSRAAFCSFRIACHDRRFDREQGQWIDGEVNWLTVSAFRGLAEHAHASFSKGDRVIVSGRLRIRKWTTEDRSGTNVEVEAEALGHDLRCGVSSFSRRTSSADQSGDSVAASAAGSEPVPGSGDPSAALAERSGDEDAGGAPAFEPRAQDGFIPSAA